MARFPLLDHLTPAEQQALLAMARRRRFRRSEVIFHEGDPGDSVHLIDKGHVAIRVTTPVGDVATVLLRAMGQSEQPPGILRGEDIRIAAESVSQPRALVFLAYATTPAAISPPRKAPPCRSWHRLNSRPPPRR